MVGTFREPSCGRRTLPIHSIPYSVAQPLERGFNNYYSIIQGGREELQDEVNEKTIALYIKTGKLTAQTLQKAMKAILSKGKKQLTKQPQGKQSLKQLMKQNAGVSNIEITKDNIKAFESTAKKYGIDFALKKDTTESPPRYLVFFKGRDADVLTAAFKEFSAKKLTQDRKPSIRKLLTSLKEAAQGRNAQREKVKNKDRGREL